MASINSYNKTVKKYDKIRFILRDIFLCNYRTRNQYIQIGVSPRSFDDYKRKIKDCIPENFIREITINKNKYLQFKTDFYSSSYNFLAETLLIKALNENSCLYLQLLQISSLKNKPLTKTDYLDLLDEYFPSENRLNDATTTYRYLEELCKEGFLISFTENKAKYYQLAKSPLDNLTLEELKLLYAAVVFYTPVSLLSSVGYFMQQTLANYAQLKFGCKLSEITHYQYRGNNYIRILDDNIVSEIDTAIRNGQMLKITYGKHNQEYHISPTAILTQYPYNRQFLLTADNRKFSISKITKVKQCNRPEIQQSKKGKNPKHTLEFLITFTTQDTEQEITDIKNRLQREAGWMAKTVIDDNHWLFTAKVYDYQAYIPWLRSFHKFITPTDNSSPGLLSSLAEDRKELLEAYGIIL